LTKWQHASAGNTSHQTRSLGFIALLVVFGLLSVTAVALRTKACLLNGHFSISDRFAYITMVCSSSRLSLRGAWTESFTDLDYFICGFAMLRLVFGCVRWKKAPRLKLDDLEISLLGYDRHAYDLTLPELKRSLQVSKAGMLESVLGLGGLTCYQSYFAAILLYIVTSGLCRMNCLWEDRLRVQHTNRRFVKYATDVAFALSVIYTVVFTSLLFSSAQPLDAFWNQVDPTWTAAHEFVGRDANRFLSYVVLFGVLLDAWAVLFAIIRVPCYKLAGRQRNLAIAGFVALALVIVAAGVHLYTVFEALFRTYDVTWEGMTLGLWASAEILSLNIINCWPSFHMLYTRRPPVSVLPVVEPPDSKSRQFSESTASGWSAAATDCSSTFGDCLTTTATAASGTKDPVSFVKEALRRHNRRLSDASTVPLDWTDFEKIVQIETIITVDSGP